MSTSIPNGLVNLTEYALILVKGPDAFTFLQGQVTCDVQALKIDESSSATLSNSALGAHCTHKGRMLFSFRACALDHETLALRLHHSLRDSAIAALKKYSVFSKVDIIDGTEAYTLLGGIGDHPQVVDLIDEHSAVNQVTHQNQGGVAIRIDTKRMEYWLPKEQAEGLDLLRQPDTFIDSEFWFYSDIQNGIGEVRAESIELFIPQMLNYQAVGDGISFTKGCYTGQEVVARMEYLGKLKRRMYRFRIDTQEPIPVGAPLYSQSATASVGNIVAHAYDEVLAVVTESAVEEDDVYLDAHHQQKLHALALPYAITKE